jgi:hypothetical protein
LNQDSYSAEEREIAREILRYLEKHPDAKDSLNGIAQWWLLREWSQRKFAKVERAVSLLMSDNLILETRRKGLSPCYQLNREKCEQISQFLRI